MPRQRKSTTLEPSRTLDARSVRWAPEDSHPAQVSGLLKHDPTFPEFREILQHQRQEDYQQACNADATPPRKKGKVKRCLSSTPTLSPTTKTGTHA